MIDPKTPADDAPEQLQEADEDKAIELPIEEGDFDAQPQ